GLPEAGGVRDGNFRPDARGISTGTTQTNREEAIDSLRLRRKQNRVSVVASDHHQRSRPRAGIDQPNRTSILGHEDAAFGRGNDVKRTIAVAAQHQAQSTAHPAVVELSLRKILSNQQIRVAVTVYFCRDDPERGSVLREPRQWMKGE